MLGFPFLAGIYASALHVVSGPDHLAAVTPLALEGRRKVWRIGFLWGLGHLSGMLLIGILFLAFKEYIPLERISGHSEQLVGVVLIAVGLWSLGSILKGRDRSDRPKYPNGDLAYANLETSQVTGGGNGHAQVMARGLWAAFGIGLLHGFAGIAHFILLLPVLAFGDYFQGIRYMVGFALGTVAAMTLYTVLLGWTTSRFRNSDNGHAHRAIRLSGALFATAIGIFWLYSQV